MKPPGAIYNRIQRIAKSRGITVNDLVDQLVERLDVERKPLIVRDRDSHAGRALIRPGAAPRRQTDEVIVSETRAAAAFRHLRENIDSIDFDELLK